MAEILQGFGGTAEEAAKAVSLLKSLSHEGRLQLLCSLFEGDLNVTRLAKALGTSPVSVSQHWMRLRAEGIVTTRREGKSVTYHLAKREVAAIVAVLRDAFCRADQAGRALGVGGHGALSASCRVGAGYSRKACG